VIVERYPAPPTKPPTIIYEKYLQPVQPPRQVIVRREICQPAAYPIMQQQQMPGRRLVREIVRQVPQTSAGIQQALVCVPQNHQQAINQQQAVQQLVPVFAGRQVSFLFMQKN
jgi:hypothetical protein